MSYLDWTKNLPTDWQLKPLWTLADIRVSSVDKKEAEGEKPVRLCNYTDVYNNDFIDPSMDFMHATASDREIAQFGLRVGDVLITKDSESWEDIGVPALVTETAEDLVCGYHLALLRPKADVLLPQFLLRTLRARQIQVQLEIVAKGMTRFGLPKLEIGRVAVPVPPLSEQHRIAAFLDAFLDAERRKLDDLRAATTRTIELLQERRHALISAAVTGEITVGNGAEAPK